MGKMVSIEYCISYTIKYKRTPNISTISKKTLPAWGAKNKQQNTTTPTKTSNSRLK